MIARLTRIFLHVAKVLIRLDHDGGCGMPSKHGMTKRGVLGLMFAAPVLMNSAVSAVAGGACGADPAVAAPGDSIYIPTAKGSRYTWVKFTNQGPGAAEIVIASRGFNDAFVIDEGGTVELTKIFGTKKTSIHNNSTTATVRIDFHWL